MSKKVKNQVVAWVLSVIMLTLGLPLNATMLLQEEPVDTSIQVFNDSMMPTTTESSIKILNASDLENAKLAADKVAGDFTIKAAAGKEVDIDGSSYMSEYYHSFSKRIKLNGTGNAAARTIEFTTTGSATVQVFALSGSSSTDRTLGIYDEADNQVTTLKAVGKSSDSDGKLPMSEATIDAAGTYNIRSTGSGINIYYVKVIQGTVETVTFADGTKPSVVSAVQDTVDQRKVNVTVSGTLPNAETDKIWVKIYDSSNKLTTSKLLDNLEADGTGIAALTLEKSGDYTIVAEAIREGCKTSYSSDIFALNDFVVPLGDVKITNVKTTAIEAPTNATLTIDWDDALNAETYDVEVKDTANNLFEKKDLKVSTCDILGLTVGETYTIKVTAYGSGQSKSATTTKKVAASVERFLGGLVGSGASGTITENSDGSITLDARAVGGNTGGKLADSEDGFLYYYTEINPETENFTLTATFRVDDSGSKDNQSGFGVMAIDTMVLGDSSARYFNSAGAMFRKYVKTVDGTLINGYGIPGGYFVTGYTAGPTVANSARKTIDTEPFDWEFKKDYTTATNSNPPKFEDGEVYTLTLRKSNTGFHAYMSNDKTNEVICYEPELLLKQDSSKYYVGMCASRKIMVTVLDYSFTTIHPSADEPKEERPLKYVTPTVSLDSTTTTSNKNYEAAFKANVVGTIDIKDAAGNVVASKVVLDPREASTFRAVAPVKLSGETNQFTAIFTPADKLGQGELLADNEELSSYESIEIPFSITYKQYGTSENAIYVRANGSASNQGTKASPLDVQTAVNFAQPGQEIVLLDGTYKLTKGINIARGNNGTKEEPIVLMSEPGKRVVFDLSNCSTNGITVNGNYWHIYNIELMNSPNAKRPVQVSGHYNTIEKLLIHDNADTGLQISGSAYEPNTMWPSYNLILSCEVYNSCDALGNDADGFAAKLTAGEGNVFRYCIAHHNIDDGWDLYAKSTTGPIGTVTIENSVAYANGTLLGNPSKTGEGNGFKLGGESISVPHVLKNSVSFANLNNGVFSNSNPSCMVYNTTSYGNEGKNLFFNTNAKTTDWILENFISYKGNDSDTMDLKGQDSLADRSNYINGMNTEGTSVSDDWFTNLDTTIVPTIAEDGSIDMKGLLVLTASAPDGIGAVLTKNPNPTVITIGKEIGGTSTGGGSTGGGSSSGGSTNSSTTKPIATVIDKIIEALKEGKTPVIKIDGNNAVQLVAEAISELIGSQTGIVIEGNGVTITFNEKLIKEITKEEKLSLTIKAPSLLASELEAIKAQLSQDENFKTLVGSVATIAFEMNTNKKVEVMSEPATLTFDLSKANIENADKLTLVRYEKQEDGTFKVVKLGGNYDAKAKTFIAKVDQVGNYGILEAQELFKLNLIIGKTSSEVNGKIIVNDVAPMIVKDTTMVPIRFIVENLGAEVKWDHEAKQATIILNGKTLTLSSTNGMLIKDARALVPLRFVSETVGANVLWLPTEKAIEIVY